jgi:hypothetical protein
LTVGSNNISEGGVRPLKTQQKISGRQTSDDVTQDRLDIRSYIDTARKPGLGAYHVLHQLMLGMPWLPPAQPISRNQEIRSVPPLPAVHQGECSQCRDFGFVRRQDRRTVTGVVPH